MRYIVNIISNCLIVRNNKIGRWISNVFLEPLKLYSIELDEVCEKHKTLISLSLAFRATPCLGLLSRFFFSLSSPSLWAKVYLLNCLGFSMHLYHTRAGFICRSIGSFVWFRITENASPPSRTTSSATEDPPFVTKFSRSVRVTHSSFYPH